MSTLCITKEIGCADIEIQRCHLNLWILPGLLGRTVLHIDLGIHVKVEDSDVDVSGAHDQGKMKVVLPCDIIPDWFASLHEECGDDRTKYLLFGSFADPTRKGVNYPNDPQYDNSPPEFVPFIACRSEASPPDKTRTDSPDVSVQTISFSLSDLQNGHGYLRIRYRVSDAATMFRWECSLVSRTRIGAFMDIRVSDLRGVAENEVVKNYERNAIKIKDMRVFAILPDWLIPRFANPAAHYGRIFEGSLWRSYLHRAPSLIAGSRFIVYQWKSDHAIENLRPFRMFCFLERLFPSPVRQAKIIIAMSLVIVWALCWEWIFPVFQEFSIKNLAALVLAFIVIFSQQLATIASLFGISSKSLHSGLRAKFRKFEHWVYHKLAP
ncbi:MAG: hypothetical protein ACTS3F_01995 [Phycisphaerales bacterium]